MDVKVPYEVKRNVLLNPGPSTTTDTVKFAQIVPDICPREAEFGGLMKGLREDLVKIVHGDLDKYTSVLFCGSGTINIDVCMNSLLPEGKKILVVNNGAYSTRAAETAPTAPAPPRSASTTAFPLSISSSPLTKGPTLIWLRKPLKRIPTSRLSTPLTTKPVRVFLTPSASWARWLTNITRFSPSTPPAPTLCARSTLKRTTSTSAWRRLRRDLWRLRG